MRLDKFLCDVQVGSRSEVKNMVRKGLVSVNGVVVRQPETKIDEEKDEVVAGGQRCSYQKNWYYLLNKPEGVVSATRDKLSQTVLDLLGPLPCRDMFPVGRLDKDTEGLLLITNDGQLAHELLSPKKHVEKCYLVTCEKPVTEAAKKRLEDGVDIGEEKKTLPAKVEILSQEEILLTITEGKFHQVKRMLMAVDNQVLHLKRISMGPLKLEETLLPGQFRPLTPQEVTALYDRT